MDPKNVYCPTIHFLRKVTEEGIEICVNDEHSIKAYSSIEVTDEGIVICVNDKHSLKASFSIDIIEGGMAMNFIASHFWKNFLR